MSELSVKAPPRKTPDGALRINRFMTLTGINGPDGAEQYELRNILFIDGGSLLWVEHGAPTVLAVWHVGDGKVHRYECFPVDASSEVEAHVG